MTQPQVNRPRREILISLFSRFYLPGMAAVAIVNLAISPFIPEGGRAVRLHDSPLLSAIAAEEPEPVGQRYEVYLLLGELGRGATLIVPRVGIFEPELVATLAQMTLEVEDGSEPPRHGSGPADIAGIYEDPNGTVRPFRIVARPGSGPWTVHEEGAIVVIVERPNS